MTPTAKAMLVSSTRPSGIIVMTPATVPLTASAKPSSSRSWLNASSTETGTMTHVTSFRTWLMSVMIWLWTSSKRLASATSLAA